MPIYVFESTSGRQVDEVCPVAGVGRDSGPRIGDSWEVEGEMMVRIPSRTQVSAKANQWQKYPYVSNRLPTTIQGCKMVKSGSRMKPLITSRKHENEVMAINDLQRGGEGVEDSSNYDQGPGRV